MDTIIHFTSNLPQEVDQSFLSTEIILGILGATITLVSLIWSNYLERRDNIIKELREKKKPTYEKVVRYILKFKEQANTNPNKSKRQEDKDDQSKRKELLDLAGDLMIWSSDNVLKNWIELVKVAVGNYQEEQKEPNKEIPHDQTISKIDAVLRAIRKDLGHKNKNIKDDEIMSMFFRDVETKE